MSQEAANLKIRWLEREWERRDRVFDLDRPLRTCRAVDYGDTDGSRKRVAEVSCLGRRVRARVDSDGV